MKESIKETLDIVPMMAVFLLSAAAIIVPIVVFLGRGCP